MSNWILFSDQQPPSTDPNEIQISYDGIEPDESTDWMENRTCMLAGQAGGYGYFNAGWGTNGSNGCDYGLICDPPTHWRMRENTNE